MIALNTGFAALATFQSGQLFAFAVQLLDLPAKAARLLCRHHGGLSAIVGHDPIRAVAGHLNPEQTHLVVFRKTSDLDDLAPFKLRWTPVQRIDAPIRPRTTGIIHLAISLERAIIDFLQRLDEQHQLLGGIPAIHEYGPKRQALVMDDVRQHVLDMIELGFAVPVGIIQPVVDQPEIIGFGIDTETAHDTDTADQALRITAILATDQLDPVRKILVQYRIIEDQITSRGRYHLIADIVPHQARCHPFAAQKAVDRIVAEVFTVLCEMRQGIVDETPIVLTRITMSAVFSSCC